MNYPANTTVITLSRPYSMHGEDVTKIEMREPTVRDKIIFEKHKGTPLEKEIATISMLCNLGEEDLLSLPAWDYSQLVEALNDFLLLSPADREKKKEKTDKVNLKPDSSTTSQDSATGVS